MKIGSLQTRECQNAKVRLLPCQISHEGETDPDKYLPDENVCSLLGRKLQGTSVEISEGILGYIADGENDLIVTGSFNIIKYWNWDKDVSPSDQPQMLVNHIKLMKVLAES